MDAQVGTSDTLAEVLANGNTTGSTNIVVSNGQSITTNTISETTSASGVTIDGVLVKDNGITASGTISLGATSFNDNDITNVGSIALDTITNDGTDVTIDSSGDIILDADGAQVRIKDAGTERFVFNTDATPELDVTGGDFTIHANTSDADIIFTGNDGGSGITALTLDMSAAGAATFNDKITAVGTSVFTNLDISGDVDVDGTLEADAITVDGTALATVIAGTTVTNATNSAHVLVTDNESTNEENLITFVEGATSTTGNVGLEMDGDFAYNPSTGTVSATIFKGNIDAVDGDFDGTLEADAITIGGTAIGSLFSPLAGGSDIVTTGALNSGSITSGFGSIDNGSSAITTTGVGSFGSLDISGAIDVDGTSNLDVVDIDGAVDMASTLTIAGDTVMNSDLEMTVNGAGNGSKAIVINSTGTNFESNDGMIRLLHPSTGSGALTGGFFLKFNANSADKFTVKGNGDTDIAGALSKGSGSFKIAHPLESKRDTHNLVHSFLEGPQADLIYRGRVDLVDGVASVNIDMASDMTDGTFVLLCRDVQSFTTNESGWTAVRSSVDGNILTIEAQDNTCTDSISWMVVGERQDEHMYETDWTDDNGKVIVEPIIPEPEEESEEEE